MKKLSVIFFVLCCGTVLYGRSVENDSAVAKSMSLVESLLLKKEIVSAHTVYASRGVDAVYQEYLNFVGIIETNYSFLNEEQKSEYLGIAANSNGEDLLNRTGKFFEIIRKYKDLLAPIIEDGLIEQDINYEKSVLYDFLYNSDQDSFKARIKTPEGFVAGCNELQVLFRYLEERVPRGFELGAEYLDKMKNEEKKEESEENSEDAPENVPAKK